MAAEPGAGRIVRRAPEIDHAGWPTLFLAFSHNPVATNVAGRLKMDLSRRQVLAYRAMDQKRPGESITDRIHRAIDDADAVAILWSELASKSPRVREEYDYAWKVGKRPCLIRFEGVPLPEDWDPDIEYLPLRGVSFPQGLLGAAFKAFYNLNEWIPFVGDVAEFATRAASDRKNGKAVEFR